MILFSASFICWFITLDIFAFWNVPLGNILSKPEIICHQNFHQNIILPRPSLTILTLDVVRGVWRRRRRKVSRVSALGQELPRLLGCSETLDEFLPLLSPVRLFRRGPGLDLQQKHGESWTKVGILLKYSLYLVFIVVASSLILRCLCALHPGFGGIKRFSLLWLCLFTNTDMGLNSFLRKVSTATFTLNKSYFWSKLCWASFLFDF